MQVDSSCSVAFSPRSVHFLPLERIEHRATELQESLARMKNPEAPEFSPSLVQAKQNLAFSPRLFRLSNSSGDFAHGVRSSYLGCKDSRRHQLLNLPK